MTAPRDSDSMKDSNGTTPQANETTLLLARKESRVSIWWEKSLVFRVLLTAFFVSVTFGVTQVPLIYIFGLMTCDEYYKTHEEPPVGIHRCRDVHQIEADTARSVALLGASTTLFGVFNLFFAGWTIKAFGVKNALLLTIFFPAVRLLIQNIGVEIGAGAGIIIIQCSQIITVVGGPAGYLLALNSFATDIVEPAERTGTLGRLSGSAMFGMAFGFLAGGLIGDWFGIIWPFRVTLILFLLCCLYVFLCLPTLPNNSIDRKLPMSLSTFFAPLRLFAPAKWVLQSGKVQKEYGVLLLGAGTFLGVLATSFIPVLLQMYSTDIFGFGTTENGFLIFVNSVIRGIFLTFAFPPLIKVGRRWLDKGNTRDKVSSSVPGSSDLPPLPEQISPGTGNGPEPTKPVEPDAEKDSFAFDLMFTKYSLITDGVITGFATFITQSWQMYLIAVILPLASGTGPAAKGTILQMCTPAQRSDALSAISLVELIARLASTSVFGVIFAALTDVGRPNLTYLVNAAIAVVGFGILAFARFPPEGSERYTEGRADGDEDTNLRGE